MSLDRAIEAVLFYKAEPMTAAALAKITGATTAAVEAALETLSSRLQAGATRLVRTEAETALAVVPEFDELIDSLRREEMKRDIGKAGAETLAIVIYRGPVSRAEIDRVRGVNSSYIVRNLEARGLVERRQGARGQELVVTTELLRHLGIREKTEMPEYAKVMNALEAFAASQSDHDE